MFTAARWLPVRQTCQFARAIRTQNIPPRPRGSLRHVPPTQRRSAARPEESSIPSTSPREHTNKVEAVSTALAETPDSENNLVTPVYIPEDPHGVIKETHPAMRILENSAIVVQRQLEMMNVLMGFEQANRYVIMDPRGNHIGYLAELDHGLGRAVARQMFRTHRSFTTHVFDKEEKEVLRFHRPFSWINSKIRVYDAQSPASSSYMASDALRGTSPGSMMHQTSANVSALPLSDMRIIGAAEQEWAPLRRKYNLFLARHLEHEAAAPGTPQLMSGDLPLSNSKALALSEDDKREVGLVQFARVDEPFLSWDFGLKSENQDLIGSVNRNFVGFARELFTDTGVYALRMDAVGLEAEASSSASQAHGKPHHLSESHPGMTLDQRAVMLATAVSIDFDYFSRHSGSGGMWPMWMPWFGGGEAAGGAAAGATAGEAAGAGAVGAASETGLAGETAAAARGLGSAEGVAAGAGSLAGYEAMQRARERSQETQEGAGSEFQQQPNQKGDEGEGENIWGQGQDPWSNNNGNGESSGGGSGGEGGDGFDVSDWF